MNDDLVDLPLRHTPAKPEKERNLRLFDESESRVEAPPDEMLAAPPALEAPEQISLTAEPLEHGEPVQEASGRGRRTRAPRLLLAGLVDVLAHLTVLAILLWSMTFFDLSPQLDQWPGFAAFLVFFSFLYTTVPLAFWGRSPGMAWWGLRACDAGRRPLTFGQTTVRWLASLLTVLLLGVPLLVILSGRSLGDWISGSITERHR